MDYMYGWNTYERGVWPNRLFAVAANANNHLVPLAWAIVEGGSESSWLCFLSLLKAGNQAGLTALAVVIARVAHYVDL